ncbi:hypothetical protein BGZ67_000628, partial [Mortierella alpina]
LRAADGFLRQGQLADLNELIVEASCRRDPLFQWGICQLLGEIAVDEIWEATARQQAMDLLVDLYWNDMEWAQDESGKGWMVAVLIQLGNTSDPAIKDHVKNLLDDLKKDGCSATPHSYPLKTRLQMPTASPLLARVQEIPYVEYDLHQLKYRRLQEQKPAVYIPPMAKPTQQAPDSDMFPLMEKVAEFLASERQVMLILGDSGAGKSTFNRHLECELWRDYMSGGQIPLFINLPALSKPENELIAEQLRMHNFTDPRFRNSGVIASSLFVPAGIDHYSAPALHQFQEAVITPFSRCQIKDYVDQYVPLEPQPWVTEDYMEKLTTIPNLMGLVTNPFLLILSLGALPSVVKDKKDLTTVRITRVALYDSFVEHWIGANKRRLEKQRLSQESQEVLDELSEDDFER